MYAGPVHLDLRVSRLAENVSAPAGTALDFEQNPYSFG